MFLSPFSFLLLLPSQKSSARGTYFRHSSPQLAPIYLCRVKKAQQRGHTFGIFPYNSPHISLCRAKKICKKVWLSVFSLTTCLTSPFAELKKICKKVWLSVFSPPLATVIPLPSQKKLSQGEHTFGIFPHNTPQFPLCRVKKSSAKGNILSTFFSQKFATRGTYFRHFFPKNSPSMFPLPSQKKLSQGEHTFGIYPHISLHISLAELKNFAKRYDFRHFPPPLATVIPLPSQKKLSQDEQYFSRISAPTHPKLCLSVHRFFAWVETNLTVLFPDKLGLKA